jgi:hypothetical protein
VIAWLPDVHRVFVDFLVHHISSTAIQLHTPHGAQPQRLTSPVGCSDAASRCSCNMQCTRRPAAALGAAGWVLLLAVVQAIQLSHARQSLSSGRVTSVAQASGIDPATNARIQQAVQEVVSAQASFWNTSFSASFVGSLTNTKCEFTQQQQHAHFHAIHAAGVTPRRSERHMQCPQQRTHRSADGPARLPSEARLCVCLLWVHACCALHGACSASAVGAPVSLPCVARTQRCHTHTCLTVTRVLAAAPTINDAHCVGLLKARIALLANDLMQAICLAPSRFDPS